MNVSLGSTSQRMAGRQTGHVWRFENLECGTAVLIIQFICSVFLLREHFDDLVRKEIDVDQFISLFVQVKIDCFDAIL